METRIDPRQREVIYNIGKDFALEGLSWENYKPFSFESQGNFLNEEKEIFMMGYKEGLQLIQASGEEEKEITRTK